MTGTGALPALQAAASALIVVMCVCAGVWGFLNGRRSGPTEVSETVLALGGSSIFIAAVLVGGFSFLYKGSFLVLLVPLLSLCTPSDSRSRTYTSVVALLCVALGVSVAYSPILTTMAGLIAASVAFGLGLSHVDVLWGSARPRGVAIETHRDV